MVRGRDGSQLRYEGRSRAGLHCQHQPATGDNKDDTEPKEQGNDSPQHFSSRENGVVVDA